MEMRLPRSVVEIIDRLESLGYEAYAVGGCVRDTLLGREPEDWDITTSAKPEAVKKAFDRTIDTGIEHGTVTVMKNHVGYEVTTYRKIHAHPSREDISSNPNFCAFPLRCKNIRPSPRRYCDLHCKNDRQISDK